MGGGAGTVKLLRGCPWPCALFPAWLSARTLMPGAYVLPGGMWATGGWGWLSNIRHLRWFLTKTQLGPDLCWDYSNSFTVRGPSDTGREIIMYESRNGTQQKFWFHEVKLSIFIIILYRVQKKYRHKWHSVQSRKVLIYQIINNF